MELKTPRFPGKMPRLMRRAAIGGFLLIACLFVAISCGKRGVTTFEYEGPHGTVIRHYGGGVISMQGDGSGHMVVRRNGLIIDRFTVPDSPPASTPPAPPPPKYRETVIPFTTKNDLISVRAVVDGKSYPAVVDTGTTGIVWPATMKTLQSGPCKNVQKTLSFTGPDMTRNEAQCRQIGDLRIGDYEIRHPFTLRLSRFAPSIVDNVIVLGSTAFSGLVLTIDYRQLEVRIRTSEYDITDSIRHSGDEILPFVLCKGIPEIIVEIDHHPARLLLDSGATSYWISAAFCRKYHLPMQPGAYMTSPFGKTALIPYLATAKISVGTLPLKPSALPVIPHSWPGTDGNLGIPLLKQYRVTIDYSRRKILLEPYARNGTPISREE